MNMHNPPHPGEIISEIYLAERQFSERELAAKLAVSPSTLNRVLRGKSSISPEMALRLSKALGRTAESWLDLQRNYDLWHARKNVDLKKVETVFVAEIIH
jgi:addiction module HigA family antidote